MKIKTESGYLVDIFGIYWTKSIDGSCIETILLGLPKGNGGLTPYRIVGNIIDRVEIIDSALSSEFIYCNSGVYHWALIEENLLNDIQEYDQNAYTRFISIIKEEGLVDLDFY